MAYPRFFIYLNLLKQIPGAQDAGLSARMCAQQAMTQFYHVEKPLKAMFLGRACRHALEALGKAPDDPRNHLLLIWIYACMNRREIAQSYWARCQQWELLKVHLPALEAKLQAEIKELQVQKWWQTWSEQAIYPQGLEAWLQCWLSREILLLSAQSLVPIWPTQMGLEAIKAQHSTLRCHYNFIYAHIQLLAPAKRPGLPLAFKPLEEMLAQLACHYADSKRLIFLQSQLKRCLRQARRLFACTQAQNRLCERFPLALQRLIQASHEFSLQLNRYSELGVDVGTLMPIYARFAVQIRALLELQQQMRYQAQFQALPQAI